MTLLTIQAVLGYDLHWHQRPTLGTMINDNNVIDCPGCIGVGIGVQRFGTIFNSELKCRWILLLLCNTIWMMKSTSAIHDIIDHPGCIGLR